MPDSKKMLGSVFEGQAVRVRLRVLNLSYV